MSVFQKIQDKTRKDALGKLRNISNNPQKMQKVHIRTCDIDYRSIRTKQILTMSCRRLVTCKEYPNRRDLKSLPKRVRKMFTSWDSGCSFIRQRVLHRNVACQWNARALGLAVAPEFLGSFPMPRFAGLQDGSFRSPNIFTNFTSLPKDGSILQLVFHSSLEAWFELGWRWMEKRKNLPTYALKTGLGAGNMPNI